MKKFTLLPLLLVVGLYAHIARAQFSLDGQLLQRAEYRHGFGRLLSGGEEPAMFIGQRARLQAQYKTDQFTFFLSAQDVRTWGSSPQLKLTDPFLSVHEAWAETKLGTNLNLKLGRQELNYDNFRFLGNLDWALQARSHDFALAKYEKEKMKLHVGAGYNQEGERLSGNLFTMPNQYKVAQFVRYENIFGDFSLSALFWNNGLQYTLLDPVTGQVMQKGIRYRQTLGLPTLRYQLGSTTLSGFYYRQLGKDVVGRKVNASNVSLNLSQLVTLDAEKGKSLRFTAGYEVLSGTEVVNGAIGELENVNRSYSPLFGTNHMHNGYMDYFYVGGRHENSAGLQDFFLRARHDLNTKLFFSLNGHYFRTDAQVFDNLEKVSRNLGYEVDLTLGYILNEAVSIQGGYSQMFAAEGIKHLQNVQQQASVQNWGYVMMIYRPTMKNRFVGLLF
jgi:hypothetical protein